MQDKILELIKNNYITIPRVLLNQYRNLKMTEIDFIIMLYFINQIDKEFNPAQISKDINISLEEIMNSIEHLSSLNLLKIELKKIDGMRHEFVNIDALYDKLLYLIINEEPIEQPTNIFSIFETEFGRTLAPMEYEIINSWIDSGYQEELIIEALKEAVYNGVFKLNYIDKILYEWNKKGIKTKKDIEKNKIDFQSKREEKKELYDYNWLEDE